MEPGLGDLPLPWKSITDERTDAELQEVWAYWRGLFPDIAPTPSQEL